MALCFPTSAQSLRDNSPKVRAVQRLLIDCCMSYTLRRLGRPGVSVQVRHDPVADTSTAVGTSSGTGERGSLGGDRGSLTGPTSLSGVNHHSLSGTGAGASGAGLSGSSTGINAGTATGVIPGGSAASGATSGQAPSGQVTRPLTHYKIDKV